MAQFALPLTLKEGAAQTRIVLGSANQAAVDALANPADWPFKTCILSGPARSGRSLLGRWFAAQPGTVVVDDADQQDETELFHTWNAAQERGEALLLIVRDEEWVVRLPDLRSRLSAALKIAIGTPDDTMVAALIESHAEQRGLALGEGAPIYLVPRVERSFAAIEELVATIDRLSLERKVPATQSIWRAALAIMQGGDDQDEGENGQARLL